MNIWLINPYGPIPSESWREYRFAMIGSTLAQAGHQAIWWTSSFSHHFKRQRCDEWKDVTVEPGFVIRLVPTPSYTRNIGFGRIRRDWAFAVRTYNRGCCLPAPDAVFASESPLTFGYAGLRLGRALGCPVIHDQMDLWPELFEPVFPSWLRPAVQAALWPVYAYRRLFYRQLDGLTALARPYLEVPLKEAPVLRGRPHALIYNGVDVAAFRAAMAEPGPLPVGLPPKTPGEVWVIFAGSLGPSYDIPAILKAAQMCATANLPVRFVLAGDGPARATVEAFLRCHPNTRLTYVGQLCRDDLVRLYGQCDIGLAAYTVKSNVEMPDKFYDYTAAGLPLVNSLTGEVGHIIQAKRLGLQYTGGDAAELLAAIERLTIDRGLLAEFATNAKAAAMEYDRNCQCSRFVELVETVVARYRETRAGCIKE